MAKKRGKDGRGRQARSSEGGGGGEGAPKASSRLDVPLWIPAVVFAVATLWVFRAFVFSDQMLYGNDTLSLGYVARAFYAETLRQLGTFPLWNPHILGGTPFFEALSGGDSLYPPSLLLLLVMAPYRALGWKLVLHILAAGFFTFGWVRRLGCSRAAALVAGLGFMLAPVLVSLVHPGHDGKIFVTALTPLLFWAVERHFARPGPGSVAGVGLVVALVLLTTHFQLAYFLFGAVGLYAVFRSVQIARGTGAVDGPGTAASGAERPDGDAADAAPDVDDAGGVARGRRTLAPAMTRFGLFLVASVAGAAAAGVQFIPAAEYVTHFSRRIQTTREAAGETGRGWSSSWSMHPEEAMDLLIPQFSGNNAGGASWADRTYWGRNATRDNLPTVGVVLLLLAAVSFAGGARPGVRGFFGALGGVSLLFALGTHTPVWGLFYALVPGIRLFRAPDSVMFLFGFAAATLAALGVDRLLQVGREGGTPAWKPIWRVLWIGTGILALLALLAASGVLTSLWTSIVYRDVDAGRLQVLQGLRPFIVRGAFVGTLLTAGVAGLAWAFRRGTLAAPALLAGLVVLVAVDQLRVDGAFIQVQDFHEWARPDPNIQALLDREKDSSEPYRLFDLIQDAQDVRPAMFGIDLAAGHHPNDLARYRELIGMVGSGMPTNLFHPNIRRLLNVRYILWPNWDPRLGRGPEVNVISRTQLQGGRPYETLYSDAGLPRARLVAGAVVKSDSEDVDYMLSDAFDPETQVVLPQAPPIALDGGPVQGSVRWDEDTPNRLRLTVTSDRPALLVVADNWYPAWHASVDGAETPVLRAYHTLRAIPVSAGEHTVEMWYHSEILVRSLWLSIASLAVLLGLAGWAMVRSRRGAV